MEPLNPFAARICRDWILVQPRDVSRGSINFQNTLFSTCSDTCFDEAGRQVETKTGMVRIG